MLVHQGNKAKGSNGITSAPGSQSSRELIILKKVRWSKKVLPFFRLRFGDCGFFWLKQSKTKLYF